MKDYQAKRITPAPPLKLISGFTLAEVLITLAIIGVVAALTIPTLVLQNQQRGWDTADSVF